MRIERMTAAVLLSAASLPAIAAPPFRDTPSCAAVAAEALYTFQAGSDPYKLGAAPVQPRAKPDERADAGATDSPFDIDTARQLLAAYAMALSNIRYHHGGRAPKTGFDCSGFVQYVFAHALGIDLPGNSASQFRYGTKVARGELRTGDLVFFHTHGKRVSHVGIYLDHGHFIHSPSTGKRVRIDSLRDRYWAKRYMGARRAQTLT